MIGLTNEGMDCVKVMHACVAVQRECSQLNDGIALPILAMSSQLSRSVRVGEFVENAVTVEYSVDWGQLLGPGESESLSLSIEGAIVVRTITASCSCNNNDFDGWKSSLPDEANTADSFVLEVPFTTQIMT